MKSLFEKYRNLLEREGVLYLNIKVIPKAQKTEFVEVLEGPFGSAQGEETLKIKVAAVPEKGKANAELCKYLSKAFDISKSSVSVVRGQMSQRKVVKIML